MLHSRTQELPPHPHPTPPHSCRYDTRKDVKFEKDAPVIGLVLQRSHLVTGDHGHYDGVVAELEARGAKASSGMRPAWKGTCRGLGGSACSPQPPALRVQLPSLARSAPAADRRWCPCLLAAWTSRPP